MNKVETLIIVFGVGTDPISVSGSDPDVIHGSDKEGKGEGWGGDTERQKK